MTRLRFLGISFLLVLIFPPVILLAQSDREPPKSTLKILGRVGKNGWYVTNLEITITATDESGVSSISYYLDSPPANTQGFSGTKTRESRELVISRNGSHSLYYYATDIFGNRETAKQWVFKLDTAAPSPWFNFALSEAGNNHTFSLSIEVEEETSGWEPASAAFQYLTDGDDPEENWGYHEVLTNCASAFVAGGWYPASTNNPPEAKTQRLSTPPVDFCDSKIKACNKQVAFKIEDGAGNIGQTAFCLGKNFYASENGDVFSKKGFDLPSAGPVATSQFILATEAVNTDNATSGKNWFLTNYTWQKTRGDFNYWYESLKSPTTPLPGGGLATESGVYYTKGNWELKKDKIPSGFGNLKNKAFVIFVNGDLKIKEDLVVNPSTALVIFVKKKVEIDKKVKRLDGFFLAEEEIKTGHGKEPLLVNGGLISGKKIKMERSLKKEESKTMAGELIVLPLSYYFNSELTKILKSQASVIWKEVEP